MQPLCPALAMLNGVCVMWQLCNVTVVPYTGYVVWCLCNVAVV